MMRKRNREPIWQPKHHPQAKTTLKTPVLEKLAANAVSFRKLLLELSLIAVATIGLGLLIKEVLHEEIILEPIEVPEDMAKQGYTGMVVAEQIADAALARQYELSDLSKKIQSVTSDMTSVIPVVTNSDKPDIMVPGAPFSFRTIARFIRHELKLPSTYVHGELVQNQDKLSLTLRNLSEPTVPAIPSNKSTKEINALLQESGDALLSLTKPSTMALLNYYKFYQNNEIDKKTNPAYKKNVIKAIEYCLKHPPTTDDSFINYLWGIVLYDLTRFDEALDKFIQATKIAPYYGYNGWGVELDRQGKYKEAKVKYKKAIEINPKDDAAFNNWGTALYNLGSYDEAIAKYQEAAKLEPKFATYITNWGNANYEKQCYDEAIAKYQEATVVDPTYARAFNNWGYALHKKGLYKKAIEKYEKAIELDPKAGYVYDSWGDTLIKQTNYDKAIAKLKKAIDLDPKYANAFYNLGNAFQKKQKYRDSIAEYQKAVERDPKHADAFSSWGVSLEKLGKTKEANEKFLKADKLKAKKLEKATQQCD